MLNINVFCKTANVKPQNEVTKSILGRQRRTCLFIVWWEVTFGSRSKLIYSDVELSIIVGTKYTWNGVIVAEFSDMSSESSA